jgi:hypothetical protein
MSGERARLEISGSQCPHFQCIEDFLGLLDVVVRLHEQQEEGSVH